MIAPTKYVKYHKSAIKMDKNDLEKELRGWLKDAGAIVVVGIGNPFRRDDYVGMRIALDLRRVALQKVHVVGCETAPESHIDEILKFKPTHILIIDAASLGATSGSVAFLEDLKSVPAPMTMHTLPLQILCEYLKRTSSGRVALIAIQPETTDFGEGLTGEVEDSAKVLVKILWAILSMA